MAKNKQRINDLIMWADEALRQQSGTPSVGASAVLVNNEINDSYNGAVAALGVAIAMGELLPALAIYYQDRPNSEERRNNQPKANRRSILDVIARIITKDTSCEWDFSEGNKYPDNLFRYAIDNNNPDNNNPQMVQLKKEVIDCSIALKHVVRTYKLVSNEKSS